MSRYPGAVWLPWTYWSPEGQPTYYKGGNRPAAVVLHRMQGHWQTAVNWAGYGHYGASWHYTVALDGRVAQHLEHSDGGYHAGIPGSAPRPTWPLWRGPTENVNLYTIGIEAEGFARGEWPEAQLVALRDLCRWLAADLGVRFDHDHFPAHAEIDIVNRVDDFDTPERRGAVYERIFEGEDMPNISQEDLDLLHNLARRVLAGTEYGAQDSAYALELARGMAAEWASQRSVADVAYSTQQVLAAHATPANHPAVGAGIPDHTHEPGGVSRA